jgi:hypothetical protein
LLVFEDAEKPLSDRNDTQDYVSIESIIDTDGCGGYCGLVDIGYSKHFRVHHDSIKSEGLWHT